MFSSGRGQVFVVGMAVFCPLWLIWMLPEVLEQYATNRWPTVEGVITAKSIESYRNPKNDNVYFGKVVYRYRVKDTDYDSDLILLAGLPKHSDQAAAEKDVAKYKVGDKVRVYYRATDPKKGVLVVGVVQRHQIMLVILSVASVIFIFGAYFIVRGWLAPRPSMPPPTNY